MSKRTLLVGLDLGERYSQLAVYDPARVEADLMSRQKRIRKDTLRPVYHWKERSLSGISGAGSKRAEP